MSITDTVESRWRTLIDCGAQETREVDAHSPLRMLIGVSALGRPFFAVIAREKPGIPALTSAIDVTLRQRQSDGRWVLALELQVNGLTDAFISLVSDLAEKSAEACDEHGALTIFLETLAEWQELLTARAEHLSESALRGLIAELWFGFQSGVHGRSLGEAARSWAGPLGGMQDFQFAPPGHCFEVKSVRPTGESVEVSSEDQLDGDHIKMAVVTLEDLADPADGITLPQLIATIRVGFANGSDRLEFNRRFATLHVDPDDPWYADRAFHVRRLQILSIAEDFPALRRSQLPKAITRTNYRIDIQYVQQFIEFDMEYPQEGHGGNE